MCDDVQDLEVTVTLDGWWGPRSAFIKPQTELDKLKRRLQKLLGDHGILQNDAPNAISHVTVTNDATPRDDSSYGAVNGLHVTLPSSIGRLTFTDDQIEVPFHCSTVIKRVHMVLFHKTGLMVKHRALVHRMYLQALQSLHREPTRPEDTMRSDFETKARKKQLADLQRRTSSIVVREALANKLSVHTGDVISSVASLVDGPELREKHASFDKVSSAILEQLMQMNHHLAALVSLQTSPRQIDRQKTTT